MIYFVAKLGDMSQSTDKLEGKFSAREYDSNSKNEREKL